MSEPVLVERRVLLTAGQGHGSWHLQLVTYVPGAQVLEIAGAEKTAKGRYR